MRVGTVALVALLSLAPAGACAHMEPPPGGPEDRLPPGILQVTPADEAIVPGLEGPVVFEFDERITQQGISEAVAVSPRTSPVQIRHGRSAIRVSLREGWQPGIIYQVTVLPSVRDLFGNGLPRPFRIVFSTGPEIPTTQLGGRVVDRVTGRPAAEARLEAIRTADSLVYTVPTDSAGGFLLDRFPPGDYQVRAFPDANENRSLDGFEARDSVFLTVGATDTLEVTLRPLLPDSTPPVMGTVTPDSTGIRIQFDDYLDPAQVPTVEQVSVIHPTAGAVEIASVALTPAEGAAGARGAAPVSGGEALPSRSLRVELADGVVLAPGIEYRITVEGIRNVNGLAGDAETTLEVDAPAPTP